MVGNVTSEARDNVEMELRHGVAGGWAVIETEVESVWSGRLKGGYVLLGPVDPDEKPGLFGASELLESGNRAADNNEGVTGDGEFVLNHREETGGLNYAECAKLKHRVHEKSPKCSWLDWSVGT